MTIMSAPLAFMRRPERVLAMRVERDNLKDICDWINSTDGASGDAHLPGYGTEDGNCWVQWEEPWGSVSAELGEWVVLHTERELPTFERYDEITFEAIWELAREKPADGEWYGYAGI